MVEENGKALIVPEALIVDIITVNAPFMITRRKYPLSKEMNANPNENKNVTFILVGARWWWKRRARKQKITFIHMNKHTNAVCCFIIACTFYRREEKKTWKNPNAYTR